MSRDIRTTPQSHYFHINNEARSNTTMNPDPTYLHFLAQNLNNEGCAFITYGQFQDAIEILKNALEITRLGISNENAARTPCACKICRTESFLAMGTSTTNEVGHSNQEEKQSCTPTKKNKKPSSSTESGSCEMDLGDETDLHTAASTTGPLERTDDDAFIYKRPLLVSQCSVDGSHYIGSTLSFIILFNIALAHHLQAIEILPLLSRQRERVEALEQPLKLYELAYQLHFQESNKETDDTGKSLDDNVVNLRLMMLITNNISQIHKKARDATKHHQCLHHLLNSLMYMSQNNASQHFQKYVLTPIEKDGIFDNLAPILKSKILATAA